MAGNHHLGYALTGHNLKRFLGQVNQNYLNLSPVVCVNGTGGIENRNSMLGSQSAAGSHLGLESGRKGYEQTRRDQRTLQGLQGYRLFQVGLKVNSSALRRSIRRAGIRRMINDFYNHYLGALT